MSLLSTASGHPAVGAVGGGQGLPPGPSLHVAACPQLLELSVPFRPFFSSLPHPTSTLYLVELRILCALFYGGNPLSLALLPNSALGPCVHIQTYET